MGGKKLFGKEFLSVARNAFGFLITEYQFGIHDQFIMGQIAGITWLSELSYVTVSAGPSDWGFAFGPLEEMGREDGFEPGDIVQLEEYRDWKWNANGNAVDEYARLLRHCGPQCLRGENPIFDRMRANRIVRYEDWKELEREERIRAEAVLSWKRKDYSNIVRLYSQLCDLSKLEEARLKFALGRVRTDE